MKRTLFIAYSLICYALGMGIIVYLLGFIIDAGLPKTIDSGTGTTSISAIATNIALLVMFGVQHTVMAQPGFKKWWTRIMPEPIERSTYVLVTVVTFSIFFTLWQPMTKQVWNVKFEAARMTLYALYALGWFTVVLSTFLINHFELFGLPQAFKAMEPGAHQSKFRTPLLYKLVRHPMMAGFIIAFWSAPTMTAGHLLFSAGMTVYILIAVQIEERKLVNSFGEQYHDYRQTTPALVPGIKL